MSLSDPIGDMLARIKNAQARNHSKVSLPSSKFKIKIADVLKSEGYIIDYKINDDLKPSIEITEEKVDLDTELIEMAETQMKVQFVTRMIRSQLELTKMGITGNPNSRL